MCCVSVTREDPDTVCELQAVEKELEELECEKMENQGQSSANSKGCSLSNHISCFTVNNIT